MSAPEVTLEVRDGVGEVVLNRPERKNAINGPFGEHLAAAVRAANEDADVRVLLLRGAGGAFCSGLDLEAFSADPAPEWMPRWGEVWRAAHRSLFLSEKPIVGAMERYAINGGAALAFACDLLVAGQRSFLQVGEVQIGMAAPYNLAWLSLRHPEQVSARIALLGDRINGAELERLGIAHACVEDERVLSEARELACHLATFPEAGLTRIKAGLRAGLSDSADEWFDRFAAHAGVPVRPTSMKTR